MPKEAGHIIIRQVRVQEGDFPRFEMLIDGEPFPWYIAEGSVQIPPLGSNTSVPSVTVTILAGKVDVEHRYRDASDPDSEEWLQH
jgi:hypothetical protein